MGRRALRKLSPDVDLTTHLLELELLRPPFRADHYFGTESPVEIEVGSGKGLFLCSAAGDHPDRSFLGIEIAGKYARFVASKLARQRQTNARIIHGDAQIFLREFVAGDSVAAVHVYFPDPWWKKRHRKRRIMNEAFVSQVERVLRPGGRFHFWTDVEEYFQLALGTTAEATDLSGPQDVVERQAAHDLDYRTHFERRTRLGGLPVYRAEYAKR